MLEKYFRNELDYLRELGKELSVEKPHLANFLSEKSSDPDVERLLEGFAFLSGNLRAKIEDQFPEFTHSLINMLWPNYLRPVPSMTIVEFISDKYTDQSLDIIDKGTELFSRKIKSDLKKDATVENESISCTFQTCRDVWLYPFQLVKAYLFNSNEQATINLEFESGIDLNFDELDLNKLRLFLGADEYSNQQLYLWLNYYLKHSEMIINDVVISLPDLIFSPVGFNKNDGLLPYPRNAYSGYRILQEYFCFPEAFFFFDISGFSKLPSSLKGKKFTLKLTFSQPLPPDVQVRKSTFRLHCVPAINLFKHHSEPVELTGQKTEYLLKGSYTNPEWYEIFSVDKVESYIEDLQAGRERKGERLYHPFESFEHQVEYAKGRTALYYKLRTKKSLFHHGFEHYLSFVRGDESFVLNKKENISVSLTCTNRDLPASLRVGDICISSEKSPNIADFKNITRPTLPMYPVLDGTLAWKLISNSSLNYLSLLEIDALKEIIKTYDLPSWHNKRNAKISQKKLRGIISIETEPTDRLFKGVSVRGLQSILYIKQSEFNSEGEMFLFCTVLSKFFALYASVNSFHKLKVINVDNKEMYEWPVQIGQHSLM